MLRDEQGNYSSARVFFAFHLLQTAGYAWVCLYLNRVPSGPVLTVDAGIATALIAWAGGPRIAQYVAPQISATATAVGQAIRDQVAKRREGNEGFESTP